MPPEINLNQLLPDVVAKLFFAYVNPLHYFAINSHCNPACRKLAHVARRKGIWNNNRKKPAAQVER